MLENQSRNILGPSVFAYLVATSIFLGYLCLALWFPTGYIWATYENLYGEWLQFGLWILTAIVAAACAFHRPYFRVFFVALSLAAIYVAMEEISWGQQLFNWRSPDFFLKNSLQHETNIHNLLTGPVSTSLKTSIRILLGTGLWTYGVLYPVLLERNFGIARFVQSIGVAPPPKYAWLFFFFGGLFEFGIFDFNEAEIAEVMVAAGLLVTALSYWHFLLPGPGQRGSAKIFWSMSQTFLIAVLICGTMTSITLARASTRQIALDRVEMGVDSFAGRYAAYGRWDTTILLYQRVIQRRPEKVSVYRELAEAYINAGQRQAADETLDAALRIDRVRIESDSNNEAAHRSISNTYSMRGKHDLAAVHSERALLIAQEQVLQWPDDAEVWFSLTLSYLLLDRKAEALDAITKAYELDPESLTFRKLFLRLSRPTDI